jgi:hypothetical protein
MNDRAASRAVSRSKTPKNIRSKPRFLLLHHMKKAGQAAGYFSSRESGINAISELKMVDRRPPIKAAVFFLA